MSTGNPLIWYFIIVLATGIVLAVLVIQEIMIQGVINTLNSFVDIVRTLE